jgi:hypothetical protein
VPMFDTPYNVSKIGLLLYAASALRVLGTTRTGFPVWAGRRFP